MTAQISNLTCRPRSSLHSAITCSNRVAVPKPAMSKLMRATARPFTQEGMQAQRYNWCERSRRVRERGICVSVIARQALYGQCERVRPRVIRSHRVRALVEQDLFGPAVADQSLESRVQRR